MWEFSNLNSGSTFWPPDSGQPQNTIVYPTSGYSYSPSFCGVPFPGFGVEGSFLQFNPASWPPLNTPAPNPTINSEPDATKTKRFLVFDHCGDQTSLLFSSVANPFEEFNPTLLASNAIHSYASNSHMSEDEMHEDTEEIDALLYSDSDYGYDDEETSTGHSPLDMEEIASSYLPAKRRRVDSTEIDALLMDTASSSVAPLPHYMQEDSSNDLSFVGKGEDKTGQGGRSRCNKRESIQATVSMLKRIIPGGKGKDTASVLDEAIQYLKLLKLQAMAAGVNSFTL
uniref:Transcription factor bHLH143-like isoform X1 n=1 Tax=Cymbidium sinense TaxID=112615 RepID=A0A513X4N9_9ASPA|nr:transcription factor bHLH143-like isoform X1 [Cymbidium sinense]